MNDPQVHPPPLDPERDRREYEAARGRLQDVALVDKRMSYGTFARVMQMAEDYLIDVPRLTRERDCAVHDAITHRRYVAILRAKLAGAEQEIRTLKKRLASWERYEAQR